MSEFMSMENILAVQAGVTERAYEVWGVDIGLQDIDSIMYRMKQLWQIHRRRYGPDINVAKLNEYIIVNCINDIDTILKRQAHREKFRARKVRGTRIEPRLNQGSVEREQRLGKSNNLSGV